jgi:hypothetical protein
MLVIDRDDRMPQLDDSAILWVAITLPLVALWIAAFWDLTFRSDLPMPRKLLWGLVMVITVYVGIAAYFASRPVPEPAGKNLGDSVPRTSAVVTDLENLSTAHKAGTLPDDAYLAQKRELLGL